MTEAELTPWYRETVAEDREQVRQIEALRHGLAPAQPSEPSAELRTALLLAVPHDADLFRAFLESRACITTLEETLARPEMVEQIHAVASDQERMPFPGPTREQLLQLVN